MKTWPDDNHGLLVDYLQQIPVSTKHLAYSRVIQRFAAFVTSHPPLNTETIRAWLLARSKEVSMQTTLTNAQWIDRYLSWLVLRKAAPVNPFDELRRDVGCRRTAPLARALSGANPAEALEALRPLPHYGSHLGPTMRDHVARMRTLGYRYQHEYRFWQFDRFLQDRPGAQAETLATLISEYAALARSAHGKALRIQVGRAVAKALIREGRAVEQPKVERILVHEQTNKRCRPFIYSREQICRLLEAALTFPSPCASFRPVTLHAMVVLAYCAGLRVGEIVRLTMGDLDLDSGAIDVRDTKFFKSRRLPISDDALLVLKNYVKARRAEGFPDAQETPLFWNRRRPYSYIRTEEMLRQVIRRAGLNECSGRGGPRVHDLRHTFVVHRMTEWYRQGINPQDRLPYLATYLGHRDINSTIVYITITQELLQQASTRFRSSSAAVMSAIQRGLR